MSGEGPPPLPEGDDPWLVLGATRGADERELKRAYARRIKVYRPDRSPEEFIRVQAAYEQLQRYAAMGLRMGVEEPEEPDAPVEAAPVEAAPPAPPPPPRVVPSDGPVTWKELSRWDDRRAAAVAWLQALRRYLADEQTHDQVKAMVEEPTFLADVEHDEVAAGLGLRAVSALAWHGGAGRRLFERLGKIPPGRVLEMRHDRARLDLELGEAARAASRVETPAPLRRYLTEASLVGPDDARELAAALYGDLDERLDHYIAWVRELYGHDARLGEAMTHRLLDDVPFNRRVLEGLGPRTRRRLTDGLRALRPPLPAMPFAVALGVIVAVAIMIDTGFADRGMKLGFWVAAGISVLGVVVDWHLYRSRVRALLIRVQVDAGVTRVTLRQWIELSGIATFRLGMSTLFMPRDHQMRLLSFIAAATFPDADDDDEDDEGEAPEVPSLIKEDDPDAPRGPVRRFFQWFNIDRW